MNETIQEVLNRASVFLTKHQREPKVAEILLLHHTNFSKTDLLLNLRNPIESTVLKPFEKDLHLHATTGKPVQQLTGYEYFYSRRFSVNEHVLIPRPETEELVQLILQKTKHLPRSFKAIDLGTGSGVIAITLKLEDPTLTMVASDVSEQALLMAKNNALELGAEIDFQQSNFLQKWLDTTEQFDLIISNPPYIAWEDRESLSDTVKHFDPELALFSKNNGLASYQQIILEAKKMLSTGGYLAFEIGYQQGEAVKKLIETSMPGSTVEIIQDINKQDRIIFAKC